MRSVCVREMYMNQISGEKCMPNIASKKLRVEFCVVRAKPTLLLIMLLLLLLLLLMLLLLLLLLLLLPMLLMLLMFLLFRL